MTEKYLKHEAERKEMGIPALPLNSEQTEELCLLLVNPPKGKEDFLYELFTERLSPGVDHKKQDTIPLNFSTESR